MPDDMKQGSFKCASDESFQFAGVFKLPGGIQCQSQMQIADGDPNHLMNVFVAQKEFTSTMLGFMYQGFSGQGMTQYTIMQSLTNEIQVGAQYTNVVST